MEICPICGCQFDKKFYNQVVCGKALCKLERSRQSSREYQRKNYRRKKDVNHNPYTESQLLLDTPQQIIAQKVKLAGNGKIHQPFCHTCGQDFVPAFKGQKYCSDQCREQSSLYRLYQEQPQLFIKYISEFFSR